NYIMNSTKNISLDEWLTIYGHYYWLDYLWFYPNTLFSIMGVILNLFSFYVFRDTETFNIPFYEYLRVYCINSAIANFFDIILFTANSYRLFMWANAYWSHFYYLYIYLPIVNVNYFYGTFLDIFITLDRIAKFNQSVKDWFTWP